MTRALGRPGSLKDTGRGILGLEVSFQRHCASSSKPATQYERAPVFLATWSLGRVIESLGAIA